eukprot:385801-Ditylum_brightwellii.AAC.1
MAYQIVTVLFGWDQILVDTISISLHLMRGIIRAKAIFCDMGDDFNDTVAMLQSCLAVYSVYQCIEYEDNDVILLNKFLRERM